MGGRWKPTATGPRAASSTTTARIPPRWPATSSRRATATANPAAVDQLVRGGTGGPARAPVRRVWRSISTAIAAGSARLHPRGRPRREADHPRQGRHRARHPGGRRRRRVDATPGIARRTRLGGGRSAHAFAQLEGVRSTAMRPSRASAPMCLIPPPERWRHGRRRRRSSRRAGSGASSCTAPTSRAASVTGWPWPGGWGPASSTWSTSSFTRRCFIGKNAPRFLITEAVRGKGGVLVNGRGQRFMDELAPAWLPGAAGCHRAVDPARIWRRTGEAVRLARSFGPQARVHPGALPRHLRSAALNTASNPRRNRSRSSPRRTTPAAASTPT